jgi:hypothetical protein
MPSNTRLLLAATLAALCVTLLACGGGSSRRSTRQAASAPGAGIEDPAQASGSSQQAIATVGLKPITKAELYHLMSIGNPSSHEVPEPPGYTDCVKHARSSGSTSNAQPKTTAELRRSCEARYRELLEPALSTLIHAQWLLGEAEEEGLEVDGAALARELALNTQGAELRDVLAKSGQTLADLRSNLLLAQLSDRIHEGIEKRTPHVTHGQVAKYYAEHRKSFAIPEQRDLHIIRTASDSSAKRVRREIESGQSFASVVKQIALPQPVYTKAAFLPGLAPDRFTEKVLNDAIFKAPSHVLEGPVKISLGYYVFEVTRITRAHQQRLAQVEAAIKQQLPEQLHRQSLGRFVTAFRAKWTARTDCRAGFVVQDCRQFKATKATPPRDPYTF